jgi:hypothetical protein
MAEPVGLTLSAVGLLPMFDTGLSLYGRLGSIKDYSADLKTLGITYEIERCRFQALQDELRHLDTTSEEQKNSTSPAEAHALKTLQQLIDAQTGQLKKGSHLSEKHAPVKRKSGHFSLPQLWNRSAAEDHETEAVTTPTLRRTIAWAASDKSRFQQTIQYLKDCNDQLELIASRDLKQLRDFKVRVAVLSPVNDEGELQQLMSQSSKSGYKCISKGAMVKSQQSVNNFSDNECIASRLIILPLDIRKPSRFEDFSYPQTSLELCENLFRR